MEEINSLLRRKLEEHSLDALVTMTPENIIFVTGTSIPSQLTVRQRQVIHIITKLNDPIVIVVNIEEPIMRAQSWIPQNKIFSYNEFTQSPILLAVEKLKEFKVDKGRIGFEASYLPAKDMDILRRELPHAGIIDSDSIYEEIRTIKLDTEIDYISDFGSQIEDIINNAFKSAKAGMTEKDLYSFLQTGFNAIGGDKLTMPVVASGERSCLLNGAPTDRILKKGDVVRVDMIGTKNNYYCDCCRTAIVGDPEPHHVNIWDKIVKAHDDAISLMKPGVDTKYIYDSFIEQFTEWGFKPIAFLGHGLGITLHEEPYINMYKSTILKKNMVLCIEPIHVIDGVCGYQLENEVLITADGHKMITGTKHPYNRLTVIKAD